MNPIYVLAILALALVGEAAADPKELLEAHCRLGKHASDINEVSEVRAMIDLLKSDSDIDCPEQVKAAILALEPVIELKNVCSQEAADTIAEFWYRYAKKGAKGKKYLPKGLKKFFLAYGMQASKLCKQTMINELQKATEQQGITPEDTKIVAEPVLANVEKLFGSDTRVEDLLAIVQAKKSDKEKKTKVNMEPKQKKYFELVQERCIHKFKPVYDTLIAPVVRLAAMGMSYNGESIAKDMSAFEGEELFKNWFAAVMSCEASLRHTPVDIPKEKLDANGNQEMITFLDEEDLKDLRQRTGLTLEEPAIEKVIDYKIDDVQVGNRVYDETDKYLVNSIAKYKHTLSSLNKFRLRMIKKIPALMKVYMKEKAVKVGLMPSEEKKKQLARTKFGAASGAAWTWVAVIVGILLAGGVVTGLMMAHVASFGVIALAVFLVGLLVVVFICTLSMHDEIGAK